MMLRRLLYTSGITNPYTKACRITDPTRRVILLIIVFLLFLIIEACTLKPCINSDTYESENTLDTLSQQCKFIKRYSDKEIYLFDPLDSNLICDIDTVLYYKEDNSRHILVFRSWINEKYFIAIFQEEKLEVLPCCDLYKISETHFPNKLVLEVYDSILQFNTLSYGVHRLELEKDKSLILYNYTDTIIYNKDTLAYKK